jgi:adenylate cyclase
MAARILVVEDEPNVAENLELLLTAKGYEVAVAVDGPEGLAKARSLKPDLMLLDVMLPKMGGLDVCRLIKGDANTKRIKIIMVTGLGRMGDVETAFQGGANDYVIKPFETERLLKKIEKVLAAA